MANIKCRLRRRCKTFEKHYEVIDLTSEKMPESPPEKHIETIDLTKDYINQERMEDFRQKVQVVFNNGKRQSMSLLRLIKNINKGLKEKFSKMEIDCGLLQMVEENEILISYDIVSLT